MLEKFNDKFFIKLNACFLFVQRLYFAIDFKINIDQIYRFSNNWAWKKIFGYKTLVMLGITDIFLEVNF